MRILQLRHFEVQIFLEFSDLGPACAHLIWKNWMIMEELDDRDRKSVSGWNQRCLPAVSGKILQTIRDSNFFCSGPKITQSFVVQLAL